MGGKPEGVDVVIDVVQGDLFEQVLLSCVRPLGTVCLVGFAAGQKPIRPEIILVKEVNIVGSLWSRWANKYPSQHREHVQNILNFMEEGIIKPRVDRMFPFKRYCNAFEVFENDQGQGNTVVKIR